MDIDRTVQITLSRKEIEQLINGDTVHGDGFKIDCSNWDLNYFRSKWKIVESDKEEDEHIYN